MNRASTLAAITTAGLLIGASGAGAQSMKPGQTFRDCPECPEMLVIPPGKFLMGSTNAERALAAKRGLKREVSKRETPRHTVRIRRAFAAGKYEVTREQFAAFVSDSGHNASGKCWYWDAGEGKVKKDSSHTWENPGFSQDGNHPAVCVSWNDAAAYVRWLSGKTGKTYRLLSEAEWEYAARAGTKSSRYWGNNPDAACGYANVADASTRQIAKNWSIHKCNDAALYTAAAGSHAPNGFGLYDMLGNVWEWTGDCYKPSYAGAPRDGSAVTTGDCKYRVGRGGGWSAKPPFVRSANRLRGDPASRRINIGFRVARTLP